VIGGALVGKKETRAVDSATVGVTVVDLLKSKYATPCHTHNLTLMEKMSRKDHVNVHEQERAVAVLAQHRLVSTLHSTLALLNVCTRCATRRPSVIRKRVKPVNKEQECVSKGSVIFSDSPKNKQWKKTIKILVKTIPARVRTLKTSTQHVHALHVYDRCE